MFVNLNKFDQQGYSEVHVNYEMPSNILQITGAQYNDNNDLRRKWLIWRMTQLDFCGEGQWIDQMKIESVDENMQQGVSKGRGQNFMVDFCPCKWMIFFYICHPQTIEWSVPYRSTGEIPAYLWA